MTSDIEMKENISALIVNLNEKTVETWVFDQKFADYQEAKKYNALNRIGRKPILIDLDNVKFRMDCTVELTTEEGGTFLFYDIDECYLIDLDENLVRIKAGTKMDVRHKQHDITKKKDDESFSEIKISKTELISLSIGDSTFILSIPEAEDIAKKLNNILAKKEAD